MGLQGRLLARPILSANLVNEALMKESFRAWATPIFSSFIHKIPHFYGNFNMAKLILLRRDERW